ncbi:MAG: FAD-dependent oxidoreductase [Proteobacteria bacterium]|nr:FAD-dependent oxidoreductase [Pseudomonadota bacterium]
MEIKSFEEEDITKKSQKTCVIVGAGMGGLACGAVLAKNGFKTLVFERNNTVGGVARAIEFNDYWLDEGGHYVIHVPGQTPDRDKVAKLAGITTTCNVIKGQSMFLLWKGKEMPITKLWPLSPDYDRATLKKIYTELIDEDINEIERFVALMMVDLGKAIATVNFETYNDLLENLPYIPIEEFIRQRTSNEKVVSWVINLATICILIPAESVATCSTYLVLVLFAGLTTNQFSYCYPTHPRYGGFAAMYEPYADVIRESGGEIHTRALVKKITIEGGKTTGVIVERGGKDQFIAADSVVCNVSPQVAYRIGLLDMGSFPNPYRDDFTQRVKTIEDGAKRYDVQIVNVHIGLKHKLVNTEAWIVILDDHGHAIGGIQTYSNLNPASAPKGKQLLYINTFLYKVPREFSVVEKYAADTVLPVLRSWISDFDENVEWMMAGFSPVVYAEYNQQMFSSHAKFENVTPVDNFYFAGMFTGRVTADGALRTGAEVAERVLGRKLFVK